MRITERQLRQIIREELSSNLREATLSAGPYVPDIWDKIRAHQVAKTEHMNQLTRLSQTPVHIKRSSGMWQTCWIVGSFPFSDEILVYWEEAGGQRGMKVVSRDEVFILRGEETYRGGGMSPLGRSELREVTPINVPASGGTIPGLVSTSSPPLGTVNIQCSTDAALCIERAQFGWQVVGYVGAWEPRVPLVNLTFREGDPSPSASLEVLSRANP
jgi:hypothetical protein